MEDTSAFIDVADEKEREGEEGESLGGRAKGYASK
jgi:hypothetical protein